MSTQRNSRAVLHTVNYNQSKYHVRYQWDVVSKLKHRYKSCY